MVVLDDLYALKVTWATQRQEKISKSSRVVATGRDANGKMPKVPLAMAYVPQPLASPASPGRELEGIVAVEDGRGLVLDLAVCTEERNRDVVM